MLQEEREVRREGAEERKENAEFDGQRGEGLEMERTPRDSVAAIPCAIRDIGSRAFHLNGNGAKS